jgi:hypothetical protein
MNVNVLLTLRNNFKFMLTLQGWQLNDCLTNDPQHLSNLLLTDYKGRRKSNDVLMSWFGLLHD